MTSVLQARAGDITRWVTEALHGLDQHARKIGIDLPVEMTDFWQGVALWSRDVEGTKGELQDAILGATVKALREGRAALESRGADPSWGWTVVETRDITGHPKWMPGMPKYCCFLKWRGPKPETWPNQIALGMKENLMSHPADKPLTW